jgi:hypothetical protein
MGIEAIVITQAHIDLSVPHAIYLPECRPHPQRIMPLIGAFHGRWRWLIRSRGIDTTTDAREL